jgi:glycosyltransferase involved in cell wall biosynthesis
MASALGDEARAAVDALGGADLLVGIPSYNNAGTIGYVVETAAAGLAQHFPELRAAVFNSDGGSADDTPRAVLAARVPSQVSVISFPYHGPSGKGSAFHAIFEAASRLGVRACVLLDSDLRSVTPDWVARLAGPIVADEADYVAPLYTRHKYDGTITNNLAYPLTRALYGVRVRQPIGGDFGVGAAVLAECLRQDEVWETDVARFGIDIWMTTTALAGGYRVGQAALGAKVHDPKDPAASLGPMFTQVVGTLFGLMRRYEARWRDVRGSTPAPVYGEAVVGEAEPVQVSLEGLLERFRAGMETHGALWYRLLLPATYRDVAALSVMGPSRFQFHPELWAHAVYDFAAAYGHSAASPAELMDALTPLYFGRTAGLIMDTKSMGPAEFEDYLERQAQVFEREKPYLLRRWDAAAG